MTPGSFPSNLSWQAVIGRARLSSRRRSERRFKLRASHVHVSAEDWRGVLRRIDHRAGLEAPAARAAGRGEVAVAPHHGMFDATGPDAIRALHSRTWVTHAAHPSITTLERMFRHRLYAGPREVFATGLSVANELANKRLTDRLSSRSGYVVVRVAPGGTSHRR
jgi:hypothetical protein